MPSITISDVLSIALEEEGYLEKRSNANLDSKQSNAGSSNYTKYGRDLVNYIGSPYSNGVAWCDMFVDWCILQACLRKYKSTKDAINKARQMIFGWSAYTPTSANYYKNNGRYFSTPRKGDQIFFKNSSRICHTGLVIGVDANNVYTIEGNTSSVSGVVANGGCVRRKQYPLNYYSIAGYGRPLYDSSSSSNSNSSSNSKKSKDQIADEVIAGLWGTGEIRRTKLESAGYNYKEIQSLVNNKLNSSSTKSSKNKTIPVLASIPPILRIKSRGQQVTYLQQDLNYVLKKSIEVDGIFGKETDKTLRQFQSKYKLVVDGEYGKNSMSQMKKLLK